MAFPFLERFTKEGFIPKTQRKAIPVTAKRPMSTAEQFAALMRSSEFARRVQAQGLETFEEADDFDIPDDPIDPTTPYEKDFDLASAAATHHGVVEAPSSQLLRDSRTLAEKARNFYIEKKSPKAATPPAATLQPKAPEHDGGSGD